MISAFLSKLRDADSFDKMAQKKLIPIHITKDAEELIYASLHGRAFIKAINAKFTLAFIMVISIYRSTLYDSLVIDVIHVSSHYDCRIIINDAFLDDGSIQVEDKVNALLTIYQEKMQNCKVQRTSSYFVAIDTR
jgi:hypothetical protein